ncbi:hypothetical protein, partial [Paracoccus sp. AS002]
GSAHASQLPPWIRDMNPSRDLCNRALWMYKWYRPGGRHSVEDVTSAIINFACHGYLKPDNLPAGLSLTPASAEAGGEAEGIGHGSGRPQR